MTFFVPVIRTPNIWRWNLPKPKIRVFAPTLHGQQEGLTDHNLRVCTPLLRCPRSDDVPRGVILYSRPWLGRDQKLGAQSRIDISAASCPLRQAISSLVRTSGLVRDHRDFFEGDPGCSLGIYCDPVDGPAIEIPSCAGDDKLLRGFTAKGFKSEQAAPVTLLVFLGRIYLTWNTPMTAVRRQPSLTLFDCFQTLDPADDEKFSDSSIRRPRSLFSGCGRPAIIDPDLPRWLRTCLKDH